jgi:phosphoglycerate dehydrogenase-like enzyme
MQYTIAGVDFIPLSEPPEGAVATNGGGYTELMAEHALAMTLAAAKRLTCVQQKAIEGAVE